MPERLSRGSVPVKRAIDGRQQKGDPFITETDLDRRELEGRDPLDRERGLVEPLAGNVEIDVREPVVIAGHQVLADPQLVAEEDRVGCRVREGQILSLIHISEPTRRTPISYAV